MNEREARYSKVFELFEHWTEAQRAECMYLLESRWCWGCGKEQHEHEMDCTTSAEHVEVGSHEQRNERENGGA